MKIETARRAIFQILGDPRGYKPARFVIDGEEFEEKISSLAIQKWLKGRGKDSKLIFLVPDSLITRIADNVEEAKNLLINVDVLKRRILTLLDNVEADVLVIPSVGTYSGKCTVRFEGSVENAVVSIFKELVKFDFDEIYADVSTGQNVYAVSLLEALRKYLTYKKLRYMLQGRENVVKLKLAYVPPVFAEGQEVKVELHEFDAKAFFSLPRTTTKNVCKDIEKRKELHKKYYDLFNEISAATKVLKTAFNAIRYNVPLVFYHRELLNLDVDVKSLENGLFRIIEEIEASKEILDDNGALVVRRALMDSNNVVNTFLAMAMLSSIVNFWREKVSKPDVDEILKTFEELYNALELHVNARFLERDVEEIKTTAKDLRGECLLSNLYEKGGGSKDPKRNFFAHSGFLREITKVKRVGSRILISYDLEVARRKSIDVRSWLLKPQ